jgi:hypothetical protein
MGEVVSDESDERRENILGLKERHAQLPEIKKSDSKGA